MEAGVNVANNAKGALHAIWNIIAGTAKSVHKLIMNADLATLIKYGIIAGVSYVTIRVIFRHLKNRRKLYHSEKNKSMVDRALEMNYADVRNQQELHPLMKKVRKNLRSGLSKSERDKSKRRIRHGKKKYRGYLRKLSEERLKRDLPGKLEDIRDFLIDEEFDRSPTDVDLAEMWHNGEFA